MPVWIRVKHSENICLTESLYYYTRYLYIKQAKPLPNEWIDMDWTRTEVQRHNSCNCTCVYFNLC